MIVNILIGGLIFGYAGIILLKFFNKAKKGKCASCDIPCKDMIHASCCEKARKTV